MKKTPAIVLAFVTILAGCSLGNRGDAKETTDTITETTAPSTTEPPVTTAPPTEGSFDAQRLLCTQQDAKMFDDIVKQLLPLPQANALIADYAPQLTQLLAQDPGSNVYLYKIGVTASTTPDSCLQVFMWFAPHPTVTTGKGNRNRNTGGNSSASTGSNTQPTVGGANCTGGNIDPDGDGPRGCEPTVSVTFPPVATNPAGPPPSVVVQNPDTSDTSPPSTAVCTIDDGVPSPACAFTP